MPIEQGREEYCCTCYSCRTVPLTLPEYDEESEDDDYEDEPLPSRDLWWHGYKPEPVFYGEGPLYLGMELEVEIPSRRDVDAYAREVRNRLGASFYLQEDSSIDHGFEVTTHPMSYSWAMENIPWDVFESMKLEGCRTTRDVGIHVHVSRAGFVSECHIYRWMKFVYRNEEQVSTLARRSGSRWASFDPHYRAQIKRYMKREDYRRGRDNRYQAINPNNEDTLEVRVFASSLRPREIKAALAFVAGSVEYTRDLDASKIIRENGWAWSSFVDWLRRHDEYRPLLDELEALACVS